MNKFWIVAIFLAVLPMLALSQTTPESQSEEEHLNSDPIPQNLNVSDIR